MIQFPASANLNSAMLSGRSGDGSPAADLLGGGQRSPELRSPEKDDPGAAAAGLEKAERAVSRFARLLEEKQQRLERRDAESGSGEPVGKSSDKPGAPGEAARPETELLRLLRRIWTTAKAGDSREEADGRAAGQPTGGRRPLLGQAFRSDGKPATGTDSPEKPPRAGTGRRGLPDAAAQALAGAAAQAALRLGATTAGERGDGRGAASRGSAAGIGASGAARPGTEGGWRSGAEVPQNKQGTVRLVVLDLRRTAAEGGASARSKNGGIEKEAAGDAHKRAPAAQERDFATLLKSQGADRNAPAEPQAGEAAKAPAALRAFQERLVPEVVRHTGIILKEGGNGEIRLLLKPESLGSVRIRLAMTETSLEGRIVVENNTVRDLMEGSLEHLKQALREGGFQSATLEVTVGNRQNGHQAGSPAPGDWVEAVGSRQLDAAVPPVMQFIAPETSLVNLVV